MRRHLVLLAAASALVVSCSGDDDDDQAAAGTEAPGRTDAGGGEAAGDYCAALADFKAATESANATDDTATPEQLEASFTGVEQQLDPLIAAAPEEIEADLELLASGTRELIDALAASDYDVEAFALDEGNQELVANLDSEEYTAAGERIDAYGERECGITIDDEG